VAERSRPGASEVATPPAAPSPSVPGSTPQSAEPTPAPTEPDGSAPDGPAPDASDPPAPAPDATEAPAEPFTNSPGIEAPPEPDPTPTVPGAVGPLPTLPDVAVPAAPAEPVTAVDALVKGFPTDVLPLDAGSSVLSSSLAGDGDRLLATVEATDPASPDQVLARTTDQLVALGFTWSETPATSGSTARSFTRDGHMVVVSVRPQSDGSLFRIVGILDETS